MGEGAGQQWSHRQGEVEEELRTGRPAWSHAFLVGGGARVRAKGEVRDRDRAWEIEREREKDHNERRGSSEAAALADSGGARERVQKRLGLGGIRALGQKVKDWPCWAGLKGRLGREKERASLES